MVTRDHVVLESSACSLGGTGEAHYFHSKHLGHQIDDVETSYISWPNYRFGANGDFQDITIAAPRHAVLARPDGSAIRYFASHPHEGAVGARPVAKRRT